MAIVQVSRITNRKGLTENLPQLAGAELGWAIDQRRLFIGNGTLQEGAPVVGNTEILTEFSDILAIFGGYTYEGAAAGYTVQTGPAPGSPITQSIQSRLDSFAIITDFGAKGDGVTDDTEAINRALFQLYCRDNNPAVRRSLFFPAGRYLISESIVIPPYARLYGEGAKSSVIVLDTSSDLSTLSDYCARFGDSLQQTGSNIGNNGATPPTNIEISSMGFECVEITDVFFVQDSSNCTFNNVSFQGPLTTTDIAGLADDIACIRMQGTASLVPTNISFNNCQFAGTNYGISTIYQTKGVSIFQSSFNTLYQGVALLAPAIRGGPSGFKMIGNVFDSIYAEGIYVSSPNQLNVSGFNTFYDVGNHFNGTTSPATSVIVLGAAENLSIGDMFQRTSQYSNLHPRVDLQNTAAIGVDSSDKVQQGSYTRQTGIRTILADNASNQTLFTFDANETKAVRVDYTIVRNTAVRTGVLTVVAGTDGSGTNLTTSDAIGVQNTSPGVTFGASESSSIVTVQYSTTSTGATALISYSITYLA
jgi:hypothetical protein